MCDQSLEAQAVDLTAQLGERLKTAQ